MQRRVTRPRGGLYWLHLYSILVGRLIPCMLFPRGSIGSLICPCRIPCMLFPRGSSGSLICPYREINIWACSFQEVHGQFSSTLYTIPQEEGSSDAKFSYVMYIVCYGIVHVHQRTCLAILRDFTMPTFQ